MFKKIESHVSLYIFPEGLSIPLVPSMRWNTILLQRMLLVIATALA